MWSPNPTKTLLRTCQCHWGLAEQSMKTTFTHPKQPTCCAFFSYLKMSQKHTHTTGLAEKHWYGVLKCLQSCNMGTKCALRMHTIMSKVIYSLSVLWISYVYWGHLTSLYIMGNVGIKRFLFQRVLWIMKISFFK